MRHVGTILSMHIHSDEGMEAIIVFQTRTTVRGCVCVCVTDLIRQPGGRITIDFYYFATFFGLFYDYYSTKITLIPTSLSSLCSLIFSSSPQFFFYFSTLFFHFLIIFGRPEPYVCEL